MAYVPPWQRQKTGQNQDSEWNKMLAQARMAMMMNGQTALGFALGKLLRGAWDNYRRGEDEKKINEFDSRGKTPISQTSTDSNPNEYTFQNPIHDMVMKYQPPTQENPAESFEMQQTDFLPGMGDGFQIQRPSMGYDRPQSALEEYLRRYQLGGF